MNAPMSKKETASCERQPVGKTGWRRVRFEEMAENVTDRVENPSESGVERYVGLEHLDPESLKIRRWGTPDEVEATKLRFKPGDIIFGKRRAYQRKLAVADFEGICSAHAMVLRAREENIVKDFLPVFMQSDVFFARALAISVGSLSPTINWKTLAAQEFLIPSKEEQNRTSKILWAAEETNLKYSYVILTLRTLERGTIDVLCSERDGIHFKPLSEMMREKPKYGANASAVPFSPNLPRFVRITDIDEFGRLISEDQVSLDIPEFKEFLLEDGDFLFARTGNTVGKTYLYKRNDGYCAFAGYLVRFRLDPEKMLPKFLVSFTKSSTYLKWVENTVRVGAQPNINAAEYAKMLVPSLPIDVQRDFVAKVSRLETEIESAEEYVIKLRKLKSTLLNSLLGDNQHSSPSASHV